MDFQYHFVCLFAQSRSSYFARRMMEKGYPCIFSGAAPDADIPFTENLCARAKKTVILDAYAGTLILNKYPEMHEYEFIEEFFIEDEPSHFGELFEKWYAAESADNPHPSATPLD